MTTSLEQEKIIQSILEEQNIPQKTREMIFPFCLSLAYAIMTPDSPHMDRLIIEDMKHKSVVHFPMIEGRESLIAALLEQLPHL